MNKSADEQTRPHSHFEAGGGDEERRPHGVVHSRVYWPTQIVVAGQNNFGASPVAPEGSF